MMKHHLLSPTLFAGVAAVALLTAPAMAQSVSDTKSPSMTKHESNLLRQGDKERGTAKQDRARHTTGQGATAQAEPGRPASALEKDGATTGGDMLRNTGKKSATEVQTRPSAPGHAMPANKGSAKSGATASDDGLRRPGDQRTTTGQGSPMRGSAQPSSKGGASDDESVSKSDLRNSGDQRETQQPK